MKQGYLYKSSPEFLNISYGDYIMHLKPWIKPLLRETTDSEIFSFLLIDGGFSASLKGKNLFSV